MELYEKSAASLSAMLKAKEISAVEVTKSFLSRADRIEDDVRAFITRTPDLALQKAAEIDEARSRGETLHPLAGVPVVLKDNLSTVGLPTTCASKILEHYRPPYDATVVEALKKAGMPLLGKTNMDEFAMGSSNENSAFFSTRNPWDFERVPGGSSGGSAAAVASGMAPLALGTDTGGSIRLPASFCGVTGLRPTYGRVSRYGVIAFASSLDQVGTIATSARDSALLLGLIAGHDPLDSTSLPEGVPDYEAALEVKPRRLRVGVIRETTGQGIAPAVREAVNRVVRLLEKQGYVSDEVSLPNVTNCLGAYYIISPCEASSNLGRYDGVRFGLSRDEDTVEELFLQTRGRGFGLEVKRRIMIGTYALSAGYYDAYYLQAMKVRTLVRRDYERAFKEYDLLIGAASPTPAYRLGEKVDDPLQMYLGDICNLTDSLAGLPSLSLPGGLNDQGLPLGIQLTGPPLAETLLLQVAHFLEKERLLPSWRPPVQSGKGGSPQYEV